MNPEIPEKEEFDFNVSYVDYYLEGFGFDMGCGRCPLIKKNCVHIDISPQPMAEELVGGSFMRADAVTFLDNIESELLDYVFSSHMVEDLGSKEQIVDCLNRWTRALKVGGHLVLLLPDMQGGRYPTVEEGGNPSHKVNVGKQFILDIMDELRNLELVQIDTIPHNRSCTIDVVFRKV